MEYARGLAYFTHHVTRVAAVELSCHCRTSCFCRIFTSRICLFVSQYLYVNSAPSIYPTDRILKIQLQCQLPSFSNTVHKIFRLLEYRCCFFKLPRHFVHLAESPEVRGMFGYPLCFAVEIECSLELVDC